MDPRALAQPVASVSNLVPVWEDADGGGTYEPAEVAEVAVVVEQAVHADLTAIPPRHVSPPEHFDAAEPAPAQSAFSYELLANAPGAHALDVMPPVDYDALRRRDIARELLRARLVAAAEQREHRSAYEIVFILLATAVAVLLAAPPLVQVLLAARGIQA
ncbi:MAG: hypothetical protein JWM98_621 [Thermoleophilia bacterium]|nr:hypothetical protein [Thermoleophilia bacterium]